jgi:hypothetical protein
MIADNVPALLFLGRGDVALSGGFLTLIGQWL